MNKFLNFYMKSRSIKSFVVGLITGMMMIVIFTSVAFGQETPGTDSSTDARSVTACTRAADGYAELKRQSAGTPGHSARAAARRAELFKRAAPAARA